MITHKWIGSCLFGALCLCADVARAWDGTGHMTVAELGWRALPPAQRTAVSKLLRAHPHYALLLEAGLPAGVDHDEWVFLRAATWPDLVRPAQPGQPPKPASITQYHRPEWHFINLPFVLPADQPAINPAQHAPPATNAVERLQAMEQSLQSTHFSRKNRAIALCWMLHLVGDVHQPLHCVSWFSPEFHGKSGDAGGNAVAIKPQTAPVKLHAYWDDLLGSSESYAAIQQAAGRIATNTNLAEAQLTEIGLDPSYAAWAQESFQYAVTNAYLSGRLEHAQYRQSIPAAEVPALNSGYADQALAVAQRRIAAAGIRLGKKLNQLF